jgi:hypothetical protein
MKVVESNEGRAGDARAPLFTGFGLVLAATLALAMGVGVNSAIFSNGLNYPSINSPVLSCGSADHRANKETESEAHPPTAVTMKSQAGGLIVLKRPASRLPRTPRRSKITGGVPASLTVLLRHATLRRVNIDWLRTLSGI